MEEHASNNTVTVNIIYTLYNTTNPLSLADLKKITGYSDKAINKYIDPLVKINIITRRKDGRRKIHILEHDANIEEYLKANEILVEKKIKANVKKYEV